MGNRLTNGVDYSTEAAATGRALSIDAYVKWRDEGIPRMSVAAEAAAWLLSDFADGTNVDQLDELAAFIDGLIEIVDATTRKQTREASS